MLNFRTVEINTYKEYDIVKNFYGRNEYSVQFCGDDVIFETTQEAKEFIDMIWKERE